MTMLEVALYYALVLGWRIFPCDPHAEKPRSKRPLVVADKGPDGKPIEGTGWPLKATTDEAQIRAWWARWPNALIGMAPGWAGGYVVDLDPKGESIEAVEARLAEALGVPLPAGPRTITQSGGRHLWFRRPEGVHFPNDPPGLKNIDIRCDGGYVILPPSVLANGNAYRWEGEPFDPETAPEVPPALLKLIADRKLHRHDHDGPALTPRESGPARVLASDRPGEEAKRRYARAALDRIAAYLGRAPQGTRGTALFTAACQLGRFVAAGAISEREALAALEDGADANGLMREDGRSRVSRDIRRGLDTGAADPADVIARLDEVAREAEERRRSFGGTRAPEPLLPDGAVPVPYGELDPGPDEEDWTPPANKAELDAAALGAAAEGADQDEGPEAVGGEVRQARDCGFDIDDLNAEWSLVLMGSRAVMVQEQAIAPIDERLRILTIEAFHQWLANTYTETVSPDGKVKGMTHAKRWFNHPKRRQYRGIEFFPNPDGAKSTPGYLNLWRGFSVKPGKKGSYAIFRDHLLNNVCEGDPQLFQWVWAWFAHLVQRPRERIGTAIVMRGKMGTGKTKVGEVMGSLASSHYFAVDDPRYVVGQFNAHMATCLLLQAEEAVWAGDKAAEGRLKGLVTSKFQMIEAKGIDPIRIMNYVRLIMTSNEDWVIPAGKDERRFCVLDINPRCAQNIEYFREMDQELDAGGREALLRDLLAFDLSTVDLRKIPRTKALLEQKMRSLDTVEGWLLDRLQAGAATAGAERWVEALPCATLFDDYVAWSDKLGVRRKSDPTGFGIKLTKMLPGLKRAKRMIEYSPAQMKRVWCYLLPSLDACRAAFGREMGQEMDWEADDAAPAPEYPDDIE